MQAQVRLGTRPLVLADIEGTVGVVEQEQTIAPHLKRGEALPLCHFVVDAHHAPVELNAPHAAGGTVVGAAAAGPPLWPGGVELGVEPVDRAGIPRRERGCGWR